jgi:heat shock protein HslJ
MAAVVTCSAISWAAAIQVASGTAADHNSGAPADIRLPANHSESQAHDAAGSDPASPLAGTLWRLVEFQSMDDAIGKLRPDDPTRYTMQLNGDGSVVMRLNCNRARGTWAAETGGNGASGRFVFGPLAATRAHCPPPSMDAGILAQAGFIRSYRLQDGRLYLSLMADGGVFAWEPVSGDPPAEECPADPEDGGPRNWEVTGVSQALNLRQEPSASAGIITRLAAGTVLDNLGCLRAEGRVWCDVQPLGGGPRGFVSASYLKPAVSPDGSVATGPDDSALRAGQGAFDATGNLPCTQVAGQPTMTCEFGVARAGGGYATVVIKRPGGRTRAIFFRMGRPIGADTSQADGSGEFKVSKEGDLNLIRIGNEGYEIPDAVLMGG